MQELTAALAQSVRGEATARGRIPPDILTASELRVIDTFAASFGVELAAAQIGDLFGGSVAGDALNAMSDLIQLLAAARGGDERAAGEAFSLLYDELRRLARVRLREHRTMTLLDTTALVHESYLKLAGIDALPVLKVVKYEAPPQRQKGIMVKDAAELVAALRQRGLA